MFDRMPIAEWTSMHDERFKRNTVTQFLCMYNEAV